VKAKATIDEIEAFLEERGGYGAFFWSDPRSEVRQVWTCEEWNRTFQGDKVDKLTCRFRKEYDLYG
jgi:phage-related protein